MLPSAHPPPGLIVRAAGLPRPLANYRLVAFDMDSTLIGIECIDELADVAGRKAEVAAITEATMRGEIGDFKASLRQRVAALRGVPAAAIEAVCAERLRLNPGVDHFVGACRRAGLVTLLVSGGFTVFAQRVAAQLGIDEHRSNRLEIRDGVLTGRVLDQAWGDICDGAEKRRTMLEACARRGIDPGHAIAIGDGANDLPMMRAAGLSIAYHAKPVVRDAADIAVVAGGMDRLLAVLTADAAAMP